jgi:hypothetical protein
MNGVVRSKIVIFGYNFGCRDVLTFFEQLSKKNEDHEYQVWQENIYSPYYGISNSFRLCPF